MVARTWLGGGNNSASNAKDWSPKGLPKPGDSLTVGTPFDGKQYVMNVQGNDLSGDTVGVNVGDPLTANLTNQAIMSVGIGQDSLGVFNLSQHSKLTLNSTGTAAVNLSQGSTLVASNVTGNPNLTINVSGHDSATLNEINEVQIDGQSTININQDSVLTGTFVTFMHNIQINGTGNAAFNNNGSSVVGLRSGVDFNVDVTGTGSIASNFVLSFDKSVGAHQSIIAAGLVNIAHPLEFAGKITLEPSANSSFAPSEVNLGDLANADSYTFKNDLLRIFDGNTVIETLHLTDQTPFGFLVAAQPPFGGSTGVSVVAYVDAAHTLPIPNTVIGALLPLHH